MSYTDEETGERCADGLAAAADQATTGGTSGARSTRCSTTSAAIVTRVGDETVGEMWSLFDGQDVLNEIDPPFSENIRRARPPRGRCSTRSTSRPTPTPRATARCGRRTRTPTCCCTWSARPTTASSCAAPSSRPRRPTPTRRSSSRRSATGARPPSPSTRSASSPTWARPGITHICRSSFAGRAPVEDYPLSNRFDEIDTMIVFDDVEIPWENVFFYRHIARGRVHPRDAAPLQHVPVRPAPPAVRRLPARRWPTPTPSTPGSRCTRACARSWPSWPATGRASTPT